MNDCSPAPERDISDNRTSAAIVSAMCAAEGMAVPPVYVEMRLADPSTAPSHMIVNAEAIDKLAKVPGICKAWLGIWGPSVSFYLIWPFIIVVPFQDGSSLIPISAEATADVIERTALELESNKRRIDPLPISLAVTCEKAVTLLDVLARTAPSARPEIALVSGGHRYPVRVPDSASFLSTDKKPTELRKIVRERIWGAQLDRDFLLFLIVDEKRSRVRIPQELEARVRPRLAQIFSERTFISGELVRDSVDDLWAMGPTAELIGESVLDLTQAAV